MEEFEIKGVDVRKLCPEIGTNEDGVIVFIHEINKQFYPITMINAFEEASPVVMEDEQKNLNQSILVLLFGTAETANLAGEIVEHLNAGITDINEAVHRGLYDFRENRKNKIERTK